LSHPSHFVFSQREVNADELKSHLQVVTWGSGQYKSINNGWLKGEQRWTVLSLAQAIQTEVQVTEVI